MKKRYKITFAYKGTAYAGWQRQENALTIQEVLEGAFSSLFGAETAVTASGRTDAGVHAKAQVAHFDADTSIPSEKIPFAINTLLPADIRVFLCEEVDESFNARFSAKRKTYSYRFYVSPHLDPLKSDFSHHVAAAGGFRLDLLAMEKAAKTIVGEHDFKCFEASGSVVKSTVRTVYDIKITHKDGDYAIFVCGNGFLYNMVRIIAGTLLYVGLGKLSADEIGRIIEAGDRTLAGKTLPANGLTLESVEY